MILTKKGELFSCGSNGYGELGLGYETRFSNPRHSMKTFKFQKINLNEFILSVSCNKNITIITTQSGKYYGWGYGLLGLNAKYRRNPTEIVIGT